MDWSAWHDGYDEPGSILARRLVAVQDQIRVTLDASPPGPLLVISMCAGQGRDLLEVLAAHPRRDDVRARLVELDPRIAAMASATARAAGLRGVEVVVGDASLAGGYAGMVPADLVLICGVFGNVTEADIKRTIEMCPRLTRSGGTVIWTRHRREPDLVPRMCEWFEASGFRLSWLSDPDAGYGVGAHRFHGEPVPLDPDARIFDFIGFAGLATAEDTDLR